MPFGFFKRKKQKPIPAKRLLTRQSTLPEINLSSPIYSDEGTVTAGDRNSTEGRKTSPSLLELEPGPVSPGALSPPEIGHRPSPEDDVSSGRLSSKWMSQSVSNLADTDWETDHRRRQPSGGGSTGVSPSVSLLRIPGAEDMSPEPEHEEMINGDGQTVMVVRKSGRGAQRQGSWRKTWSRSFKKNILGIDDDPGDPEAARLKKYRTRRKKYGGKHFIIAIYQCKPPAVAQQQQQKLSTGSYSGVQLTGHDAADALLTAAASADNVAVHDADREPDTFCAEVLDELNFETRNDPTNILPETVTERQKEKLRKTLAHFFYSDIISEDIAYNYFMADVNNECKEFVNMRFPFVIVFYHDEDQTSINCLQMVKVLRGISHDYNQFKIDVLADMVFGTRDCAEKKSSLNMPYVFAFGRQFHSSKDGGGGGLAYHTGCSNCELLRLIMTQRDIEGKMINDKKELYRSVMQNRLLRNNLFHTALITYNLVMCGLYAPVDGMMGRKSHNKRRDKGPDDDFDEDYISD